jgi:hypothetical protein
MASMMNDIHNIKVTHHVLLEIMKDKMGITDDDIAKFRPEDTVLNKPPPGRPPKGAAWDPVNKRWTKPDGSVFEKPVHVSTNSRPTSTYTNYKVNTSGLKTYTRPKGAARNGWEWDYFQGTWVVEGTAWSKEKAIEMHNKTIETNVANILVGDKRPRENDNDLE